MVGEVRSPCNPAREDAEVSPTAIVAEDLHKHFGDVVALDGVSLTVPTGTVLGLLGPNGAGKTTAVRILTTILRPERGRASVLGIDVATEPQAVRTVIGLAGQYAAVDENLTGRENLRMVGRLTHLTRPEANTGADELLERFGLADAGDRPLKTYSGGMRRRLDLAAALVHRPPVLFLDEPTTGLDPWSRQELWRVIEELVAEGTTVLLTTQYLEEADRLAHTIAVVDGGRVIAEGTPADLKTRLGTTILDVGVSDREAARRVGALLAPLGELSTDESGTTVSLQVASGPKAIMAAVRALDAAAIEPALLAVREPTLNDVFLRLTGHGTE